MQTHSDQTHRRPTVTAIIPTYNRAKYIGDAIRSLLGQTVRPSQIIVVDDGSKDNTGEVLAEFSGSIEAIRKANGGKASALNLALSKASGDCIWIFDDDDVATPDALERLSEALELNPECGFSFGRYDHLIQDQNGRTRYSPIGLEVDRTLGLKLSLMERCLIFQPGLLVRRACYDATGPFNESMVRSQDYEMLLRLSRTYKGVRVDSIVFHQRQHAGARGTAGSPIFSDQMTASWIRYDRLIFSRVYDEYLLSEFLPNSVESNVRLTPGLQLNALLERCCIMARKGLWEYASEDLQGALTLISNHRELSIDTAGAASVKRIFGAHSYAGDTLNEAAEFFRRLSKLAHRRLRWRLIGLLFWPFLRELAYSVRNRAFGHFANTAKKARLFWLMYLREANRPETSTSVVSGI